MNMLTRISAVVAVCLLPFMAAAESYNDGNVIWQYFPLEGSTTEARLGDGSNACVSATANGNLTLPNQIGPYRVTTLSENAFAGCAKITGVTLPENLEAVEEGAFDGASALKSIDVSKRNINFRSFNGVLYSNDCWELVRVPEGFVNKEFDGLVRPRVEYVRFDAFRNCANIRKIAVSDNSVEALRACVFAGCSSFEAFTWVETWVEYDSYDELVPSFVKDGVLYSDENFCELVKWPTAKPISEFESIVLTEESDFFVADMAFAGNPMEKITIPAWMGISSWAFYDCPNLKDIGFLGCADWYCGVLSELKDSGIDLRKVRYPGFPKNMAEGWENCVASLKEDDPDYYGKVVFEKTADPNAGKTNLAIPYTERWGLLEKYDFAAYAKDLKTLTFDGPCPEELWDILDTCSNVTSVVYSANPLYRDYGYDEGLDWESWMCAAYWVTNEFADVQMVQGAVPAEPQWFDVNGFGGTEIFLDGLEVGWDEETDRPISLPCVWPMPEGEMVIPDKIAGLPVLGIGNYAFSGLKTSGIRSLTLPCAIVEIDEEAIYALGDWADLEEIRMSEPEKSSAYYYLNAYHAYDGVLYGGGYGPLRVPPARKGKFGVNGAELYRGALRNCRNIEKITFPIYRFLESFVDIGPDLTGCDGLLTFACAASGNGSSLTVIDGAIYEDWGDGALCLRLWPNAKRPFAFAKGCVEVDLEALRFVTNPDAVTELTIPDNCWLDFACLAEEYGFTGITKLTFEGYPCFDSGILEALPNLKEIVYSQAPWFAEAWASVKEELEGSGVALVAAPVPSETQVYVEDGCLQGVWVGYDEEKGEDIYVAPFWPAPEGELVIPANVREIRSGAFMGLDKVTKLVLPRDLECIEESVGFETMSSLAAIEGATRAECRDFGLAYWCADGFLYDIDGMLIRVPPAYAAEEFVYDDYVSWNALAGCHNIRKLTASAPRVLADFNLMGCDRLEAFGCLGQPGKDVLADYGYAIIDGVIYEDWGDGVLSLRSWPNAKRPFVFAKGCVVENLHALRFVTNPDAVTELTIPDNCRLDFAFLADEYGFTGVTKLTFEGYPCFDSGILEALPNLKEIVYSQAPWFAEAWASVKDEFEGSGVALVAAPVPSETQVYVEDGCLQGVWVGYDEEKDEDIYVAPFWPAPEGELVIPANVREIRSGAFTDLDKVTKLVLPRDLEGIEADVGFETMSSLAAIEGATRAECRDSGLVYWCADGFLYDAGGMLLRVPPAYAAEEFVYDGHVSWDAFSGCRNIRKLTASAPWVLAHCVRGGVNLTGCDRLEAFGCLEQPGNGVLADCGYAIIDGAVYNTVGSHLCLWPNAKRPIVFAPGCAGGRSESLRFVTNPQDVTELAVPDPDGIDLWILAEEYGFTGIAKLTFEGCPCIDSSILEVMPNLREIVYPQAPRFAADWASVMEEFEGLGVTFTAAPIPSEPVWYGYGCLDYVWPAITGVAEVPEGFREIYENAFADMPALTELTFPASLYWLDSSTPFSGCTSLAKLIFRGDVPDGLSETLENVATVQEVVYRNLPWTRWGDFIAEFNAGHPGTTVKFTVLDEPEEPVWHIQDGCLYGEYDAESGWRVPCVWPDLVGEAEVPGGVAVIGEYAFAGMSNLTTMTLPASVTWINPLAFADCVSLAKLVVRGAYLPDGFKDVLAETPSVTEVVYNSASWRDWQHLIGEFKAEYPERNVAFMADPEPSEPQWSIEWGNERLHEDGILYGEYNEESGRRVPCVWPDLVGAAEIPEGVAGIGEYAFACMSNLTAMTLPASVTWVEPLAFADCVSLAKLVVRGAYLPDGFKDVLAQMPSVTEVVYNSASWRDWQYLIGEFKAEYPERNVVFTADPEPSEPQWNIEWEDGSSYGSLYGEYDAESGWRVPCVWPDLVGEAEVPDRVVGIGGFAFACMSNLTAITLPASVDWVDSQAFADCVSLAKLVIMGAYVPDGFKDVLAETPSVTEVVYNSASWRDWQYLIGEFKAEYPERNVVFMADPEPSEPQWNIEWDNVRLREYGYLYGEYDEESGFRVPCVWPDLVGEAEVPGGVAVIGEYAFACMSNLTAMTLPASVTWIDPLAFADCVSLKKLVIKGAYEPDGLRDLREAMPSLEIVHEAPNWYEIGGGCVINLLDYAYEDDSGEIHMTWSADGNDLVSEYCDEGDEVNLDLNFSKRGILTFEYKVESDAAGVYPWCGISEWDDYFEFVVGGTQSWDSGWRKASFEISEPDSRVNISMYISVYSYNDGSVRIRLRNFQWTDPPETVTITLDPALGKLPAGQPAQLTLRTDGTFGELPVPCREGCEFMGWSEYEWGWDDPVEPDTPVPFHDMTLVAQWEVPLEVVVNPNDDLSDLVFNEDNDGQWNVTCWNEEFWDYKVWRERACYDGQIAPRSTVEVFSATFSGVGALKFSELYGRAYVYYSGWTDYQDMTVLVDGEPVEQMDALEGGKFVLVKTAGEHRLSIRFENWLTDYADANLRLGAITFMPAPAEVEVEFDFMDGAAVATKTYKTGVAYGEFPEPSVHDGHEFLGWFTAAQGGREVKATEFVDFSIENLYAQWSADLNTALDSADLKFASDGPTGWLGQSGEARVGITAAASGFLDYNETNTLSTTVIGKGVLSFWWKTDDGFGLAEMNLTLTVDGRTIRLDKPYRAGNGWLNFAMAITNDGPHVVTWSAAVDSEEYNEWASNGLEMPTLAEDMSTLAEMIDAGLIVLPGAWVDGVAWTKDETMTDVVKWGDSFLQARRILPGETDQMIAKCDARIEADANDYEAHIRRALARIKKLGEDQDGVFASLLARYGYEFSDELMAFVGELDVSDAPLSNDAVDMVAAEVLPAIADILADLEIVPEGWAGCVALSPEQYPVDEPVYVDYADVTFAKAAVHGARAAILAAQGYDLAVDNQKMYEEIVAASNKETLTVAEFTGDWADCSVSRLKGFGADGFVQLAAKEKKLLVRLALPTNLPPECATAECVTAEFELVNDELDSLWLTLELDEGQDIAFVSGILGLNYLDFTGVGVVQSVTECGYDLEIDLSSIAAFKSAAGMKLDRASAVWSVFGEEVFNGETYHIAEPVFELKSDGSVDNPDLTVAAVLAAHPQCAAKIRDQASLDASKAEVRTALELYGEFDAAIRSRTTEVMHFFEYDEKYAAQFDAVAKTAKLALEALDEVVTVKGEDFACFKNFKQTNLIERVTLKPFFDGKVRRWLLPPFEGSRPYLLGIPDITFAGTFPDWTMENRMDWLLKINGVWAEPPVPTVVTNTITYLNLQGAVNTNATEFTEGDLPLVLGPVEREGYKFLGWTPNDGVIPQMTPTNVTFTAIWKANEYTVLFDGNGEDSGTMMPQTFSYGESQALASNSYSRMWHVFEGWSAAESGGGTVYADGAIVSNLTTEAGASVTLYAIWKEFMSLEDHKGQQRALLVSEEIAGPQPWSVRVATAIASALKAIDAATTHSEVDAAGNGGRGTIEEAMRQDAEDAESGGKIPGSELVWEFIDGTLYIAGEGPMPALTRETAPWSNSVDAVECVSIGKDVLSICGGLFSSDLSAPVASVTFGADDVTIPLAAFVDADGTEVNADAIVLFLREDKYAAPQYWIGDDGEVYASYAEAFAAGCASVVPAFSAAPATVEEAVETAPAVVVEKVSAVDEKSGQPIVDKTGGLIEVEAVTENVNSNDVPSVERIVATEVKGLTEVARTLAIEGDSVKEVKLTIDSVAVEKEISVKQESQLLMFGAMTENIERSWDFETKFAEISLSADGVPVHDSPGLIRMSIPYVTQGRMNFNVARIHGGGVQLFREIFDEADAADLTFMVGDSKIDLWSMKFSDFAIGSMSVEPPDRAVTFDANGGSVSEPVRRVVSGSAVGDLPTATRTGYVFLGWFSEVDKGMPVTPETVVKADVTFYARWGANAYEVHFDPNGGDGSMPSQEFVYDEAQRLRANAFTRVGYGFIGWATSADGEVVYEDGEEVCNLTATDDGVVNLYAVWGRSVIVWTEDAAFSSAVANTYDGYLIDGDCNLIGCVQVKTAKQSVKKITDKKTKVTTVSTNITATATVTDANGKKWSYSKGTATVEGEVTGLKCTKKDCPVPEFGVSLGKNGLTGEWDGYRVFGARNGMGVKGDAMMTALEAYKGKWSVAISGDWDVAAPAGDATEGHYMPTVRLQLNVQAKGVVKVAGNWESGEKVSTSAQLVMGDGFAYLPLTIKATKTTPAVMALLRIEPGAAATGMSPPQAVTLVSGGELIAGGRTVASLGKVSYLESEMSRGGAAFSARVAVDELAYPAKFSAKGLPAGLKINAATGVISGTPTKPGFYTATVTVTSGANSKVKETVTVEFEIENYTDDLIPIEDAYGPYYVGVAVAETINAASGCSVSGLPSGLKWTAKNVLDSKTKEIKTAANTIYGVPTKVGTSTVYFKKSVTEMVNGKQKSVKHQASATVYVEGMKSWAIGTFNGGGEDGMVTLTVGKTGKLSGKWMCDGKSWSLSAASFDAYAADSEVYYATLAAKCGKETSEIEIELTESGVVAYEAGSAKIVWEAWRNAWKETSMKDLAARLKGKKVTVGEVTLTVGANGAVSAKGSFVTGYDYKKQKDIVYSATCSTVLIPGKTSSSFVVYLYFPPKAGKFDGFADRVEFDITQ